jgi:hypothetical protein
VPSNTGGKTHSISSGFLNEATNAIWSGFLMSQFGCLTSTSDVYKFALNSVTVLLQSG